MQQPFNDDSHTKHAEHLSDSCNTQQVLVSDFIANAAKDETEDESEQVGQA